MTGEQPFTLISILEYCRQDSNLREDCVPYNIESVVTSTTSRLQHNEQFDMECTAHWFMLWSQQLSLLNGTLSGIVPNHRTLLRFELRQGSLRNISEANLRKISKINEVLLINLVGQSNAKGGVRAIHQGLAHLAKTSTTKMNHIFLLGWRITISRPMA